MRTTLLHDDFVVIGTWNALMGAAGCNSGNGVQVLKVADHVITINTKVRSDMCYGRHPTASAQAVL